MRRHSHPHRGGPLAFRGEALSHIYPSNALLELTIDASDAAVAVASSDGAGGTTAAARTGAHTWSLAGPAFIGAGYQAGEDPLATLPQKRAVVVAESGESALLQEMGADTVLDRRAGGREPTAHVANAAMMQGVR